MAKTKRERIAPMLRRSQDELQTIAVLAESGPLNEAQARHVARIIRHAVGVMLSAGIELQRERHADDGGSAYRGGRGIEKALAEAMKDAEPMSCTDLTRKINHPHASNVFRTLANMVKKGIVSKRGMNQGAVFSLVREARNGART